jgi:hypothetical protein
MSRHGRLIDQLFQSDEDRALARAFAEKFGDVPGMADRVAPLLQEAARSAEQVGGGVISPEDARSYLASFASEALGMPPHLMSDLTTWFDNAGVEVAAEQPPQPEAEQQEPAAAPPAQTQVQPPATTPPPQPAGPTRAQLQAEITKWESAMRAEPGSAEWRSYWQGGGSAAYLAALQGLDTAPETLGPATIAGGEATLAQPAPGAAPAQSGA